VGGDERVSDGLAIAIVASVGPFCAVLQVAAKLWSRFRR
jgi:hypothetical protein